MNILKYLKVENRIFRDLKFNDVDSLILSQFSYMKTERECPFFMKDIDLKSIDFADDFVNHNNNRELIKLIINNPRFKDLEIVNYKIIEDSKVPEFFRAYSIKIDENTFYVSMGGTGGEVADWMEDFCMSYDAPIKSQKDALKFLEKEMEKNTCDFYVGGHSKGGNLSEFAAMNLDENLQKRLINIYSFDGPGFKNSICSKQGYINIRGRIKKFIPTSSLVGTLLENDDNYKVIQSRAIGIFQHNTYSFEVKGQGFIEGKFSRLAQRANDAISIWLKSKSEDERREFTESFFSVAKDAGFESFEKMGNNFIETFSKLLEAYNSMEKDKKQIVVDAFVEIPKIFMSLK